MSYLFQPGAMYRMPTHFGPSLGPRQGPDNRRYDCKSSPYQRICQASFAAVKEELDELLPPGFVALTNPSISFSFSYATEIEWLAGRGYNTFGVTFPVKFNGRSEVVEGHFLAVLWENHADPIITGRDELGFSKVYCEIPERQEIDGKVVCRASWDGFEFASLTLIRGEGNIPAKKPDEPAKPILHYKYIPKTGEWGKADAEYAVETPVGPSHQRVLSNIQCDGTIAIRKGTWEQLPTLVHIVNALGKLSIGNCRGASVIETRGLYDLRVQRILK